MKFIPLKRIMTAFMLMMFCFLPAARCEISAHTRQLVEEYVQQVVISRVLYHTQQLVTRIVREQNIQIMPSFVYQSIQMGVQQVFEQKATKDIVFDAFEQARDLALDLQEKQENPQRIEAAVRNKIDGVLSDLNDHPVYRKIIELIFEQASAYQNRIIAMTVAQRRAQLALVQQQYLMAQRALLQSLQNAVKNYQGNVNQTIQQYHNQFNDRQFSQYEQTVQSQYQNMISQYERAMQQQYNQFQQQYEQMIQSIK